MKKQLAGISIASALLLGGCGAGDLPFIKKDEKSQEETSPNKKDEEKGKTDDRPSIPASSFNEIQETGGKKVIQNAENILVLVNKEYTLPRNYTPGDLVKPEVRFSFGESDEEKSFLRKPAAKALEEMFRAADADGIELFAVSGYRSFNRQELLFQSEIDQVGKVKAKQAVAYPGTSEHQTGLTMDIASRSTDLLLTEGFESVPEGRWLTENAYKFGFILRYPKGRERLTGYQYEPWHFRYVGREAAALIHDRNYTLEEFFKMGKKI
ncbi:D-alanyl-D-alanine carboxypeptidase family protein [Peribacillus sp. SCS-37]|uniref:M15 family metallopeptidase n=1 Tax=Paraperibacillus esterisolvens TaxID=3115296 RepID=UPI003905E61A